MCCIFTTLSLNFSQTRREQILGPLSGANTPPSFCPSFLSRKKKKITTHSVGGASLRGVITARRHDGKTLISLLSCNDLEREGRTSYRSPDKLPRKGGKDGGRESLSATTKLRQPVRVMLLKKIKKLGDLVNKRIIILI